MLFSDTFDSCFNEMASIRVSCSFSYYQSQDSRRERSRIHCESLLCSYTSTLSHLGGNPTPFNYITFRSGGKGRVRSGNLTSQYQLPGIGVATTICIWHSMRKYF